MLGLRRKNLSILALLLLWGTACVVRPVLQRPFLVLHFADVDLVIEKESAIGDALRVQEGNLRFNRIHQSVHFNAEGSGAFTVRGQAFQYRQDALTCECGRLDKSLGAILVRVDGSLVPVNLLPLLAE